MRDGRSELESHPFLIYRVGPQRYGLALELVERVLAAAEVSLVPGAAPGILGVLDLHGRVVGVIDMWRKLGWQSRPLRPSDRFVVVAGPLLLAVEEVVGVVSIRPDEIVPPDSVAAGLGAVQGLLPRSDGLVILHDVERFLASELEGLVAAVGLREEP